MDGDASARDYGWLAAGALFAVLTVSYLWRIAAQIVTDPSGRDAVLLGVVGVVIALGGTWLNVGAWRRTVWGAPERERH
jgi:hypothetical protein